MVVVPCFGCHTVFFHTFVVVFACSWCLMAFASALSLACVFLFSRFVFVTCLLLLAIQLMVPHVMSSMGTGLHSLAFCMVYIWALPCWLGPLPRRLVAMLIQEWLVASWRSWLLMLCSLGTLSLLLIRGSLCHLGLYPCGLFLSLQKKTKLHSVFH